MFLVVGPIDDLDHAVTVFSAGMSALPEVDTVNSSHLIFELGPAVLVRCGSRWMVASLAHSSFTTTAEPMDIPQLE